MSESSAYVMHCHGMRISLLMLLVLLVLLLVLSS